MQKEKIICPHCGEPTIAKEKVKVIDWAHSVKSSICMLCGGELQVAQDEKPAPESSKKLDALSDLLGGAKIEDKSSVMAGEKANFCKDCKYFVVNPFKKICGRHDRDTEPMNDCGDFEKSES